MAASDTKIYKDRVFFKVHNTIQDVDSDAACNVLHRVGKDPFLSF